MYCIVSVMLSSFQKERTSRVPAYYVNVTTPNYLKFRLRPYFLFIHAVAFTALRRPNSGGLIQRHASMTLSRRHI